MGWGKFLLAVTVAATSDALSFGVGLLVPLELAVDILTAMILGACSASGCPCCWPLLPRQFPGSRDFPRGPSWFSPTEPFPGASGREHAMIWE